MHIDHEAEVRRQIAAYFFPVIAGIIGAHYVPVLLHEQRIRARLVHGHVMHAMPNFRIGIGNVLRTQSTVDRLPACAAVIAAEGARRRDRNVNSFRITGIENDGVQAHTACAGLPLGTGTVST